MKRALLTLLLGSLVAAVGFYQVSPADTPKAGEVAAKTEPRVFAVLVGISEYADKQIKPRPNAEKDAKALYEVLTDKDYQGIDPKNVKLLLGKPGANDKAEKATRANFLKALRWVAAEAGPNDLIYLSFIGEGGPLGESGDRRCYFLADSTFKGRDKDAVGSDEVEEVFKKYKGKLCVFLDIDFKGFVVDPKTTMAEPTLGKAPYREFLGDDGTEDHLPLQGRVAFLATNGLSPSLDLKDHGIFTTVLLEGLKGKADVEGYEPDGLVTVDEMARYMNKRLPELAQANGKTDKEKEQDHFILTGGGSHFVLATNPAAIGTAKKRLAKLEDALKAKEIPATLAEEARTLLTRMPLLKKRQDLRKAYQELVDGKIKLAKFTETRDELLESMKLKDEEARQFAKKVWDAIELIKDQYVRNVDRGQMVVWAITELYHVLEEKIPEKIENQFKKAKILNRKGLLDLLADARQALGKREDLDNQKDLNIALLKMLAKLDPHTTYIDPETVDRFEQEIRGNFTGIGIQIRKDLASDQLLVVTPIKGSPAYKAGIWAGDIITTIIRDVDSKGNDLKETEKTPTKGMSLNKAVTLIKGQPDTKVKLMVQRQGKEKPFEVEVTRGTIDVESVLGVKRKANDEWDYVIDRKNKIGYIRLTSFAENSYREFEAVMHNLVKKEGIKGFILDLRGNPGGLLESATQVTDLFIDDGLIVSIRKRAGKEKEEKLGGRSAGSLLDFPMVCLVNGKSASGSEIVSAALQDHKRAVIIGERSYGKGSVQSIKPFEVPGLDDKQQPILRKARIKLTTATFWRPSGKNLNKASTSGKDEDEWGVTPDKIIKLTPKERFNLEEYHRNLETIERPDKRDKPIKEFKDKQLETSLEYLRGMIKLAGEARANKAG